MYAYNYSIMNCNLTIHYDLIYGFVKWSLPPNTIEVDLKFHTLKGMHTYKKDYKTQINCCSPWEAEIIPYPELKKEMVQYLNRRRPISTPF